MAADFTPSSFLCTRFFRRASRKALSWDLWPAGAALYTPSTPAFTRNAFFFQFFSMKSRAEPYGSCENPREHPPLTRTSTTLESLPATFDALQA